MKYLITVILASVTLSLLAQNQSKEQFDSLLVRAKVDFNMPENCEEIDLEFMRKIPHDYAVRSSDSSFQIRYLISPLDTWFADYNKKSKKEKKESMHPDALCKSMTMLAVMGASGNKSRDYQVSPLEITNKLYNADWSASAMFESGWPDEGYKYYYLVSLHKNGIADIHIYVLINEMKDVLKVSGLIGKSIQFQ